MKQLIILTLLFLSNYSLAHNNNFTDKVLHKCGITGGSFHVVDPYQECTLPEVPVHTNVQATKSCLTPRPNPTVTDVTLVGAIPNDSKDDTSYFQQAIDIAAAQVPVGGTLGGTVTVPAGIYNINKTGINLKSGIALRMDENAVLMLEPNNLQIYAVLQGRDVKNIDISGGQIIGDRLTHTGTTGEWGMGIGLYSVVNVNIEKVKVTNAWGDGIYIGRVLNSNTISNSINICKVDLDSNRRQGLAVVSGKNIIIKESIAHNTTGLPPNEGGASAGSGFDIEANGTETVENIQLLNNISTNNHGSGISFGADSSVVGLRGINNKALDNIIENSNGGIVFSKQNGGVVAGNIIKNQGREGLYVYAGVKNATFKNNIIFNSGLLTKSSNGHGIVVEGNSTLNTFTGNKIINTFSPYIIWDSSGGNSYLNNNFNTTDANVHIVQ